jgi:hypothetical protein
MAVMGTGMLGLRELHGPYGTAWERYLVENPDEPRRDFIPDWFLIKLMRQRLLRARDVVLELIPPTHNPEYGQLDAALKSLNILVQFVDYGRHADPVDARQRVLAALLGHQD